MTRCILTTDTWNFLQESLREAGRYITANLKMAVEGILWRLRTGSPWRDLPQEFGLWNSVYRLYHRWTQAGIIDDLLELVEGKIDYRTAYVDGTYVHVHQHATGCRKGIDAAIGLSRGGKTTKIHGVCDRRGKPVIAEITAGNISDVAYAETTMLDDLTSFNEVVADKGYDSDNFRIDIFAGGSIPVIPIKANSTRKNHGFHKTKYKNRHRIENMFARLKHFRSIATRYDKTKKMFESTVKIGLIATWLGLVI